MDLLEMISGNRVHYAMNTVGGVRRDLDEGQIQKILDGLKILEERSEYYFKIGANETTFIDRLAGVGYLSKEHALSLCAVGPDGPGLGRRPRRPEETIPTPSTTRCPSTSAPPTPATSSAGRSSGSTS